MDLRFTVWQFVRLMVHLEDRQTPLSPAEEALLVAWQDVWAPLDQDLTRLAESDADAYSEMMMDQDVVIEDASPADAVAAQSALSAVIQELDREIAACGDRTLLDSLKFERHELSQLVRKLGRRGNA